MAAPLELAAVPGVLRSQPAWPRGVAAPPRGALPGVRLCGVAEAVVEVRPGAQPVELARRCAFSAASRSTSLRRSGRSSTTLMPPR